MGPKLRGQVSGRYYQVTYTCVRNSLQLSATKWVEEEGEEEVVVVHGGAWWWWWWWWVGVPQLASPVCMPTILQSGAAIFTNPHTAQVEPLQ